MGTLCQDYSGIVINQNAAVRQQYDWRGAGTGDLIYQTFQMPIDYQRGTSDNEVRFPDLSGLQLLVSIDAGYSATASITYSLQWLEGVKWQTVASDTAIGAQADGAQVWFDMIFANPVAMTQTMAQAQWRLAVSIPTTMAEPFDQPVVTANGNRYAINNEIFTAILKDSIPYPITYNSEPAYLLLQNGVVTWSYQEGISEVWLTDVSPLPIQGLALQDDGLTNLISNPSCLNFRLLSLQADSGLDFLGNEYRSTVITSPSGNVQTTEGNVPVTGGGQSPYWMSQILPSPTAVEALYFDVRPVPTGNQFGELNLIQDPSFEYDPESSATPAWWTVFTGGGTGFVETSETWAASGTQSLEIHYTGTTNTNPWGIKSPLVSFSTAGASISVVLSAAVNITSVVGSSVQLLISFYDANQVLISTTTVGTLSTVAIQVIGGAVAVPTSTAFIQYTVEGVPTGGSKSLTAYVDAISARVGTTVDAYFDGDFSGCEWQGQKGNSVSAQVVEQVPTDGYVVINSALIDPITPNMNANIYYSVDDTGNSDSMTQADWDSKLWARVPQVYQLNGRKQYVFPNPVHAKYMKVELTNPQPQTYNPGDFQLPTSYQQFPTWVQNYFFTVNTANPFTAASTVTVQYDALTFAYVPFLGDLDQSPADPVATPTNIQNNTNYWNPNTVATVDSTTLSQINLSLNQFVSPLGSAPTNGTIGGIVNTLNSGSATANGPIGISESDPNDQPSPNITLVSSLNRDAVLAEQTQPDMYFYLVCRHAYKQSVASFDYNRGYVFGINEVAFMRNNYAVASDSTMYIETSGDNTNIELSDFTLGQDGNWYVYTT